MACTSLGMRVLIFQVSDARFNTRAVVGRDLRHQHARWLRKFQLRGHRVVLK